jgi:hypothetical protein
LADFRLSDADVASLTREVIAIADRHCQGRVVSALLEASLDNDT